MKTEKQQISSSTLISSSSILPSTTPNSSNLTKSQCLDSRNAPCGAVVCSNELSSFRNCSFKVPEETNQNGLLTNDDIENRTKIMMRFMDDLTNIYFSTRNSLRLSVENGLLKKSKSLLKIIL